MQIQSNDRHFREFRASASLFCPYNCIQLKHLPAGEKSRCFWEQPITNATNHLQIAHRVPDQSTPTYYCCYLLLHHYCCGRCCCATSYSYLVMPLVAVAHITASRRLFVLSSFIANSCSFNFHIFLITFLSASAAN